MIDSMYTVQKEQCVHVRGSMYRTHKAAHTNTHTHTHVHATMAGCGCVNISNLKEDIQGDDNNYPVDDVTTSQEKVIISTSAATG